MYDRIYNAGQSGFSAQIPYDGSSVGHKLQVIFRYSDQASGEGNRTDYRFKPFDAPQMPHLDGKTQYTVRASEVNLTGEDGHYLIKMK